MLSTNFPDSPRINIRSGASFTKQLSKNLGLSSSLSEKFTLIPREAVRAFSVQAVVPYDVTAALIGKSCSPWIFRRISVTV